MYTKLSLILSFIIIVSGHAILLNTQQVKKPTKVVSMPSMSQPISIKKVTIKQKEIKKQEQKVEKVQPKKRVEPKKIVKKAKKKVLKKTKEKIVKKVIKEPKKIVKKEQKKLAPTVTKKITPKKTTNIVSLKQKNRLKNAYLLKLREKIEAYKTYPKRAKRLKQQGQVVVSFEILEDGKITNANIINGSKFKRLNHAAIKLIEKIVRFDPIPKELNKNRWNIEIPINYSIG